MTKADFAYYLKRRDKLRETIAFLDGNPNSSASISSGSGSKSYTFADRTKLSEELEGVEEKITIYKRSLSNPSGSLSANYVRWC